MLGAIIGDVVGSRFEFDRGNKSKLFKLFTNLNEFTDDTVMTIAVYDGIRKAGKDADIDTIKKQVIKAMHNWGKKYPNAGYGMMFYKWLFTGCDKPYGSYGNGSAMRVSSVGWLYDSLEKTLEVAKATAEVTHNHPQGIIGAQATAAAIYLARTGSSKEQIKNYIEKTFNYDLSRKVDDIRENYYHVETCQKTVPEAIVAFLESDSFEDSLRTVISLGGDSDTTGAINGAIAQAYYGIDPDIEKTVMRYIPNDMKKILDEFQNNI